jgi:hypothetical protein
MTAPLACYRALRVARKDRTDSDSRILCRKLIIKSDRADSPAYGRQAEMAVPPSDLGFVFGFADAGF